MPGLKPYVHRTTRRRRSGLFETKAEIAAEKPPEEEIGTIQGKTPGSKEEWRYGRALELEKIRFFYQFVIRGRPGLRGAITLDFLIFVPMATPVQVYGEYWHSGRRTVTDRLQENYIRQYIGKPVDIVYAKELPSIQAARDIIRSKYK